MERRVGTGYEYDWGGESLVSVGRILHQCNVVR
jgi:hypothetical protein